MPSTLLRLAILISGNGSNLQAIIDAIAEGRLQAQIVVVVSNKEHVYGLERAQRAGIATVVISQHQFKDHLEYEHALQTCLDSYQPDLIILAGFMRILSKAFVDHYPLRILNIHPSLLPKYPGLKTHQRALAAKDTVHGVSIHIVTAELDSGPIIAQMTTAIVSEDNEHTLENKIHTLEHQLYPKVIQWYAQGRLQLTTTGIFLDGKKLPKIGIQVLEVRKE